jgi:cell wall-associated NlpC family hydrolase
MNVTDALARAASMIGKGTKYKLGSGGMDPNASTPVNLSGECDCSGFVCWCFEMSRKTNHPAYVQFNGGWINTDAIVHDAVSAVGFFSRIDEPRPGALYVYPSPAPKRSGHVGIISKVGSKPMVIHCSSGNFKAKKDAIQETDPKVFLSNPKTIIAWFAGFGSL